MKTRRIWMTIAAAAMLAACTTVDYDPYGAIAGTVVDEESGEPVGQVTVSLSPGMSNTYTGNDGLFGFKDLEPQRYTVQVQRPGYGANRKDVEVVAGETARINITMTKQQ